MVPEKIKSEINAEYFRKYYPQEYGGVNFSFSQQGEDLALSRYFQGKKNGFYVDIGAFHPLMYSNTYLFYLRGWKGINVEPNPDIIPLFLEKRPRDKTLNFAIGNATQPLAYYRFEGAAINTFDEAHKEKWLQRPGTVLKDILMVQQVPLITLFEEQLPEGTKIDFLDVDVENLDLKVLQSNDWNRYRPELVLAEHDFDFNEARIETPLVTYMYEQGYRIHEICCGTLIFKDYHPLHP